MKILFPASVLAVVLLATSCGDGKSEAAKQMAAVADSIQAATTIDLAEHHLPLVLHLPVGLPEPSVIWQDDAGKLDIRAGEHFALEIYEVPFDMARLKADLERDLVKQNTVVAEHPDLLIFRSEFPDDSALVFYHFQRSITAGGRSFTITDPMGGTPFTREDVERMAKAVHAKEPT